MKILRVDDDKLRARALAESLAADPALIVVRADPACLVTDAIALHAPDVVIVDLARPDRDALDGLHRIAAHAPRPVAMFVDADDAAFMEAAIRAGVSSYNVIETPPRDVKPILRAAVALFARHQHDRDALLQVQRCGEVFAPMHWTDIDASAEPVGAVVDATADPHSGQLTLKATGASLGTARRQLRQLAAAHNPRRPAARKPALALPDAAPLAPLPGAPIADPMRAGLLAGRRGAGLADGDGPRICPCVGVGRAAIRHAVATHRLRSAAEIGAHLRAGTNCGSCIPELEEILRDVRAPAA